MKRWVAALLALPSAGDAAPPPRPVLKAAWSLRVAETAGIRRGNYPAGARVELDLGELRDPSRLRLLLGGEEVPLQATIVARWPDESIRLVDLNFNASIAPLAQLNYRMDTNYSAQPVANERLEVVETTDALTVGKLRFGRESARLLQAAAFGRDVIGDGLNAFTVIDGAGKAHVLAGDARVDIVKPGPLAVQLRYSGVLALSQDYPVPFTITVDVPNSKSWVRLSAAVDDPRERLREIVLHTSLALSALPWTWDFGTGSWSYGALRDAEDAVTLTQQIDATHDDWQIWTSAGGEQRLVERAAGARPRHAEGWGHLQDGNRVVAFAVERFAAGRGTHTITLDGLGQMAFSFAPARPQARHELAVYLHFVASPAPIGAATPPVAMSTPLAVTVERIPLP